MSAFFVISKFECDSDKYSHILVAKFVSYSLSRSSTSWQHSSHMPTGLVAGIFCETLNKNHSVEVSCR